MLLSCAAGNSRKSWTALRLLFSQSPSTRGAGKRGRIPEYICHRQRTNGGCANKLRVSVAEMNEAVLCAIEEHALTPEAIENVVLMSEMDDVQDAKATLERERKDVTKRIANITAAIEADGMGSLLRRLRELEDRLRAIDAELKSLHPIPRLEPAVIEGRLAEWRRLLRQSTTQGRTVIQRVVRGRLTFTPRVDGDGYEFTAPTRFDRLFSGIVTPRGKEWDHFVGRTGLEHLTPEDTFDADYGRLLEAASSRKGWCARRDSNPRPIGSKPIALSN